MQLDVMKYTNSNGGIVDFMSSTIRSNPRESKLWSYTNDDTSLGMAQKEFDLTVICTKGANTTAAKEANDAIDKLTYDADHSKWGVLEANGWFLDCCFTGVTGIDTDLFGVVVFTAHFVAKTGFKWYQKQIITWSDASGSGTASYTMLNLKYPIFEPKIFLKAKANSTITLKFSGARKDLIVNVPSGETKLYYLIDSHNKTAQKSATYSSLDTNNYVLTGTIDDAMSDIDSGFFFNCKASGTTFVVTKTGNFVDSTEKSIRFELYLNRGMPTWIAT